MAVIDFPNTPIVGATFSVPGGANYRYDGAAWVVVDPTIEAPAIPFHTLKGYAADELVVKSGRIYRCKASIPAHAFVAAEWVEVGAAPIPPGVEVFDPTKNYAANALVSHQGEIYYAPAAGATAGPFDAIKWLDVVPEPAIHVYSEQDKYSVKSLVVRDGKIYRCKTAITTPGAWDATKWEDMTPPDTPHGVEMFSDKATYLKDALATHNGRIYRAKANLTAGPWLAQNWDDILFKDNSLAWGSAGGELVWGI